MIDGIGSMQISAFLQSEPSRPFTVADGPLPIDLRIGVPLVGDIPPAGLTKGGAGVALLEGAAAIGMTVAEGALLVTGAFGRGVTMTGGALAGTGTVGAVTASGGRLAPGLSPGRFLTGDLTLNGLSRAEIELNGATAGAGYDQLDVRGAVSLGDVTLTLTTGFNPPPDARFTIIDNDGTDPVTGTFADLPEGAHDRRRRPRRSRSPIAAATATTSCSPPPAPMTYYLAEGATGAFFDDDVLIANPNDREAPVTLTFLQEGGGTIVEQRTSRRRRASRCTSTRSPASNRRVGVGAGHVRCSALPLVVERTMFWDASYYGGHTANAVAQPETRWIFAEGFQGFFDTYMLIANANATPTTATLTFLRENDTPFVTTGAGRRVRAQDDLCRRLSRARRTRVRHRRRGDAAGDRRARDVLREPAGAAVGGRARQHRHRRAVDVVVPRGGRDRRLLQHVHPAEQSAGHRRARRAALPARHGRR